MNLPSINHPTNLGRLNLALERGRNLAIHAGIINSQQAFEAIVRDAQAFEPIMKTYYVKVVAIKNNDDLSAQGKEKRLEDAFMDSYKAVEKLDRSEVLKQGVANTRTAVVNAVTTALDKDDTSGSVLGSFQVLDMRRYLQQLREEKKAEHAEWLAEQEAAGNIVPDQMRRFNDPVEHLFLEACSGYDKERNMLFQTITKAPWPIQLLSQETLQKGKELLEKRVAPEAVDLHEQAKARQLMYGNLMEAVYEALKTPDKLQIYPESRQLQSDQERAAEGSFLNLAEITQTDEEAGA